MIFIWVIFLVALLFAGILSSHCLKIRRAAEKIESIEITERGVWVRAFHRPERHGILWEQVEKIFVEFRSSGYSESPIHYLIYSRDNELVQVPGRLAEKHGLLVELKKRFPGMDSKAIGMALTTADEGRLFVVWRKG